jgi:hypothetical protein
MKHLFYAAFAASSLIAFSSCHKDQPENHIHTGTAGALEFEMEHTFGTSAFQVSTPFVDTNGDTVVFNSGNYHLSHIRFIKTDGSFYEDASIHEINLAVPGTAMFDLTEIPNGDYTGVQFAIGSDTSTVFSFFSGSLANANFDYSGFTSSGPVYTPIYDFGSILTISPDAAPVMHMSLNLGLLFANGITPSIIDTIQVGSAESETVVSNLVNAISFEHLHQ